MRSVESTVSGFTPAPDILIKEYGFVTALVWGRVWRYCQGQDGVCRAKLETIAKELKMSVRTIIRHIDPMVADGYLKDTTPDLRNRPHIYADTGKIRIRVSVEASMSESQSAMSESHGAVTESHRQSDRESLEESNKKPSKKEFKKEKKAATPQPPEILIFRDVVKHYPKQNQRELVIDAIQKINTRLGRYTTPGDLQPFFTAWGNVSGNEWSLVWLTEWAVTGVIPGKQNPVNQFMSKAAAKANEVEAALLQYQREQGWT